MNNRVLAFTRYSLFSTLLLSTSVMAMDQDQKGEIKNLSSKVPQISLKHPIPPTVTLENYVSNLCLNGEIDRWGNASGNLASWLN